MLDENFSIRTVDDGEYWEGNIDKFMEMYESGVFYWRWKVLEAQNAVQDEERIRMWCNSGVVPVGR